MCSILFMFFAILSKSNRRDFNSYVDYLVLASAIIFCILGNKYRNMKRATKHNVYKNRN